MRKKLRKKMKKMKKEKQAGAELCQAQNQLGQAKFSRIIQADVLHLYCEICTISWT